MRTVTSVEAQNRFGELLDNAQREPITITRRGRPVAFVLSPAVAPRGGQARRRGSDSKPRKLMDVSRLAAPGWQACIGLENGLRDVYVRYVETVEQARTR